MVPDLAKETNEVSTDPQTTSPAEATPSDFMPALTKVLRLSISGYSVDVGSQSSEDEDPYIAQGGGARPEGGLVIPAEMPVDLRVKLAIAMVNTNREVPEVYGGVVLGTGWLQLFVSCGKSWHSVSAFVL